MKRNNLFFVKASTAAGLLLLLSCDSAVQDTLVSVPPADHNNEEARDRNKESSVFQWEPGALPSVGTWGGGEKEETQDEGSVAMASSPLDELQQFRDSPNDSINEEFSDKAEGAVGFDWQSRMGGGLLGLGERKQKGSPRPSPSHRWRGRSPSSFSTLGLLSKLPAGNARGLRRFRFLAAVASSVALVILGQKLSEGIQSEYLRSLLGRRQFGTGAGEDKRVDEDVSDGEGFVTFSRGDRERSLLQPFILILFLSVLLGITSVSWALPVRRWNEQGREEQQGSSEEVEDKSSHRVLSWITRDIPAHQLPREKLVEMRRAAGLSLGEYGPRVDYQKRSDGSLRVVVGRAWKKAPDGPWADGEACIRFSYLGHLFRVYLPKSAEEVLTEKGLLNEFVEAMSRPPVTSLSGRYSWNRKQHSRVVHWGPPTRGRIYQVRGPSDVKYQCSLPWSVYFILADRPRAFTDMDSVLKQASRALQDMHEQGADFQPTLLETVDKDEL